VRSKNTFGQQDEELGTEQNTVERKWQKAPFGDEPHQQGDRSEADRERDARRQSRLCEAVRPGVAETIPQLIQSAGEDGWHG
jgi:hypothetical protein